MQTYQGRFYQGEMTFFLRKLEDVKKDGLKLENIPIPKDNSNVESYRERCLQYAEICLEAVKQNGTAIKFISKLMMTYQDPPLSQEQYRELCLAAVQQNGMALELVPSPTSFEDSPSTGDQYQQLCLEAVKQNGMALMYVLQPLKEVKSVLNEKQYEAICLAAVKQNGMMLALIKDDELKSSLINKITPEKILYGNYKAKNYFPKSELFEIAIRKFLSNIENIVITKDQDLINDNQLKDIYEVYANQPKRSGKTIHIDQEYTQELLDDLKIWGNKTLNFVLLGHATQTSTDLANINVETMNNYLEQYENITSVTLLSCCTAKSKQLEEEKKFINENYLGKSKKEISNFSDCGMVLMRDEPDIETCKHLLNMLSKKQLNEITKAYILLPMFKTKEEKKNENQEKTYKLIYIKKSGTNNDITKEEIILNQKQVDKLQEKLVTSNKAFKFPEEKALPIFFRGGAGAAPLNTKEIDSIIDIIYGVTKFDKQHPAYNKQRFLFFRSMLIDQVEAEAKLQPSLLKKFVAAISKNKKIQRDIIIKGYLGVLSVDTKDQRLFVTGSGETLYSLQGYGHSTFLSRAGNIIRSKLYAAFNRKLNKLESGEVDEEETFLKAVKVLVTHRK